MAQAVGQAKGPAQGEVMSSEVVIHGHRFPELRVAWLPSDVLEAERKHHRNGKAGELDAHGRRAVAQEVIWRVTRARPKTPQHQVRRQIRWWFSVGLGGIEPPTSALSVLSRPLLVPGLIA